MSDAGPRRIRSIAIGSIVGLLLGVAATSVSVAGAATSTGSDDEPVTLRLGYFPNVTHATAIVGVEGGHFEDALGDGVDLELVSFSTGTAAIEALFADAIDATYIGPNPAINGFAQSDGEALRIIAGATSGGAFLVTKPEITKPKDLKGATLATPSLGNTQDVALRSWLKSKGLETDTEGGGDVSIVPQDNALTLEAFIAGDIDGAWVPEPWATRLIDEGGATVLVNEADLWPDGQFVTTHLIVAKRYLDEHAKVVRALLEGHVAANDFIAEKPEAAQDLVAEGIENITGKAIPAELVVRSFANLTFTNDPIASSLQKSAEDAERVGLLEPVDLEGIYDLERLNKILAKQGKPTVSSQ